MYEQKQIIISGEILGDTIIVNRYFDCIYNISPLIIKNCIEIINDTDFVSKPIRIKKYDFTHNNCININFKSKNASGEIQLAYILNKNNELLLDYHSLTITEGENKGYITTKQYTNTPFIAEKKSYKQPIINQNEKENIKDVDNIQEKIELTSIAIELEEINNKLQEELTELLEKDKNINSEEALNSITELDNDIEDDFSKITENNVFDDEKEEIKNNTNDNSKEDCEANNPIENIVIENESTTNINQIENYDITEYIKLSLYENVINNNKILTDLSLCNPKEESIIKQENKNTSENNKTDDTKGFCENEIKEVDDSECNNINLSNIEVYETPKIKTMEEQCNLESEVNGLTENKQLSHEIFEEDIVFNENINEENLTNCFEIISNVFNLSEENMDENTNEKALKNEKSLNTNDKKSTYGYNKYSFTNSESIKYNRNQKLTMYQEILQGYDNRMTENKLNDLKEKIKSIHNKEDVTSDNILDAQIKLLIDNSAKAFRILDSESKNDVIQINDELFLSKDKIYTWGDTYFLDR